MTNLSFAEKLSCAAHVSRKLPEPSPALDFYYMARQKREPALSLETTHELLQSIRKGAKPAEWFALSDSLAIDAAAASLLKLDMIWDAFAEPEASRVFSLHTVAAICAAVCMHIRVAVTERMEAISRNNLAEVPAQYVALRARAIGVLFRWEWIRQKRTPDYLWRDLVDDFVIEQEYGPIVRIDGSLPPGSAAYELARCALLRAVHPQSMCPGRLVLIDFEIRHLASLAQIYDRVISNSDGIAVNLRDGTITSISASMSRKWLGVDSRYLRYFNLSLCKQALETVLHATPDGSRRDIPRLVKSAITAIGHNSRSETDERRPTLMAASLAIGLHNVRTAMIARTHPSVEPSSGSPRTTARIRRGSVIDVSSRGCRITLPLSGAGEVNPGQLVWIQSAPIGIDCVAAIAWIERNSDEEGLSTMGIRFLIGRPMVLTAASPNPWSSQLRVERFVSLMTGNEGNACRLITPPDEYLDNREISIPEIKLVAHAAHVIEQGTDYDLVEIQCI